MNILALLSGFAQAVAAFFGWQRDRDLVQAGEDRAVKEGALENLRKVREAADARARVDHSPDGVLRDPDRRD